PRVGAAADADPVLAEREALAGAAAAGADHQRRAAALDRLVDVDRLQLPRVVDRVGHRRRFVALTAAVGGPAQVGAALLAVVGALGVDETAFGTVDGHRALPLCGGLVLGALRLAGEDLGQLRDVVAGDQRVTALALLAQAVDQLRAEDVDLAVQDAALVGDLVLFLRELVDQALQLFVAERAQIRKGVLHLAPSS